MRIPWAFQFAARVLILIFALLSAGYCLLAYIPFTYQQIHVGGLLGWLTVFVLFHPLFYWLALLLAGMTLLPELLGGKGKNGARAILGAGAVAGVVLTIRPVLVSLGNDTGSAIWSVVWLVPLVAVGALDWWACWEDIEWSETGSTEDAALFPAFWQTGALLAILYFAMAAVRLRGIYDLHMTGRQWLWVAACTVVSQLLLFTVVGVVLDLVRGKTLRLSKSVAAEFASCVVTVWVLGWLVIRIVIFPTLSLSGAWNWVLSIAVSGCVAIFLAGTSLRIGRVQTVETTEDSRGRGRLRHTNPVESGLGLLLAPFGFLREAEWWKRVLVVGAICIVAWYLSNRARLMDWDYLLQKTLVSLLAVVLFACFYSMARRGKSGRPVLAYGTAALILLAYLALGTLEPKIAQAGTGVEGPTRILDEYADYDVAFRLADDLLTQPRVGTRRSSLNENFYAFLAENTHIPRSRRVEPVDVELAQSPSSGTTRKPHIFIFVIDSLRRDYLSAYNPAVDFTPAIEDFARESVVFTNAFTRYGGTGLSEPSIWVGGLMLHKQYITPFAPMNALQKLIEEDKYRALVSKDTILQTVVAPSPSMSELDEHIGTMNYEFCTTLTELTGKVAANKANGELIFAYTQPQDIHVSVIDREGRSAPAGEKIPTGFDRAYASRLRKMDGCFGRFIGYLKQSGMYEDSVVVLTSDHGDFLGEHGQYGHAYSLAPEVARIPLIVHLPSWMASGVKYDTSLTAFTSDITPSLYYLLGHRPILQNGIYGRPLFTESLDEQTSALRDSYLLASSYAPVYGLLMSNGHLLYVADGVNYTDYAYELSSDGSNTPVAVTADLRKKGQEGISDQVKAIAHFYRMR